MHDVVPHMRNSLMHAAMAQRLRATRHTSYAAKLEREAAQCFSRVTAPMIACCGAARVSAASGKRAGSAPAAEARVSRRRHTFGGASVVWLFLSPPSHAALSVSWRWCLRERSSRRRNRNVIAHTIQSASADLRHHAKEKRANRNRASVRKKNTKRRSQARVLRMSRAFLSRPPTMMQQRSAATRCPAARLRAGFPPPLPASAATPLDIAAAMP